MVGSIVRKHTIPFRHQVMTKSGMHSSGSGMGSLILQKGGPGVGSSYMDIDDYMDTTGRNPFKSEQGAMGKGLRDVMGKLSKLSINPPSTIKRKNITM